MRGVSEGDRCPGYRMNNRCPHNPMFAVKVVDKDVTEPEEIDEVEVENVISASSEQ